MRTIFIAEDDEDDKDIFRRSLNEAVDDVELIEANNGWDLLQTLDTYTKAVPDVIFLDINMPRMNGFQLLDVLKSNPILKDIPVVVVTTGRDESDVNMMWDKGAHYFVTKPDNFRSFITLFRLLLDSPEALRRRSRKDFVLNLKNEAGA